MQGSNPVGASRSFNHSFNQLVSQLQALLSVVFGTKQPSLRFRGDVGSNTYEAEGSLPNSLVVPWWLPPIFFRTTNTFCTIWQLGHIERKCGCKPWKPESVWKLSSDSSSVSEQNRPPFNIMWIFDRNARNERTVDGAFSTRREPPGLGFIWPQAIDSNMHAITDEQHKREEGGTRKEVVVVENVMSSFPNHLSPIWQIFSTFHHSPRRLARQSLSSSWPFGHCPSGFNPRYIPNFMDGRIPVYAHDNPGV